MIYLNTKRMREAKEALFAQIKGSYSEADSFKTEQAPKYIEAWDYYLCKLPTKVVDYGSPYIEPVLREAVDRILPQQMNIFTASESQAVAYRPMRDLFDNRGQPMNTAMVAKAVNTKINEVFLRENNGYESLNEAITETLVSGGSFMKWFIEETRDEDCVDFKDWVPAMAIGDLLGQFPDTDVTTLERKNKKESRLNPMTQKKETIDIPMIKGKLDLLKINRNIKVTNVNFDEVFTDKNALDIQNARYLCHRQVYTVGELIDLGFDAEKLENADMADESTLLSKRTLMVDGEFTDAGKYKSMDPMEKRVYLYEHYIYSSLIDKKKKTKLYRVFATNADILEIHEVDYIPFTHGKAITIPGSFLGNSLFNVCKPYQDVLSHFVRLNLDNITKRIHGRYYAVKGQYDKRSLMDYRPNGIVEVAAVNAVMPETIQAAPEFESMMSRVSESRDRALGTQSGNQLETTSLNNVSGNTIGMLLSNQEIKDKRIAGTLARTLIRPMFEGIYRLLREEAVDLTLDDGSVFNTANLPKLSNFAIDVSTEADHAIYVNTLVQAVQLGNTATPTNPLAVREVLTEILKTAQVTNEDINRFVPPPPQPTPEQKQEEDLRKALELDTAVAQVENVKALTQMAIIDIARKEVETSELIKDGASKRQRDEEESVRAFQELELKANELGLKMRELEEGIVMDRAELELEAAQDRPILIGG